MWSGDRGAVVSVVAHSGAAIDGARREHRTAPKSSGARPPSFAFVRVTWMGHGQPCPRFARG
jgi:hypothetical protein